MLDHGPVARSDIAGRSGLSPAAVSRQTTGPLRAGPLRERARAVGRAASLLLDVFNPAVMVVTEPVSVLHEGHLEEIRGAAPELSHVCDGPERIVVPHAGPAVLPEAAATVLLSRVFQDPVGTLREGEITPAGMVPPERAPLHSSHDGPA
ncbi:hypothetical protein [Streptomyces yangpuensis]|uniref:hypothetical protein n=1 Tax=Streptomyces yangpuensis TaxID=1648182 RepID=UPI00382FC624